ncbi:MAG: UvrD-helicase domain-containing protein [Lachnospiraceae bacterium]|nr:UvrD-helicase domain-containing protein [Lachnospiraceae bacterium]
MDLNERQWDAVRHTEGPVLILAGAGSGKTRVLTSRIAYLIGEAHVAPWNILAITFTNKAAGEMRSRVEASVPGSAQGVLCATFHAACLRILRRYADRLGYDTHFSIYDSDDSRTLMKNIVKRFQLETRDLKLRRFLGAVSSAKDELLNPTEYLLTHQYDRDAERIAKAYTEYQQSLKAANAMDFDDLIFNTVELFRKHEDVLEEYQERYRYINVDEYQDTNNAQFELIRLLSAKYRNLCVVGDDDQSIYRFRGANIRNILDFEQVFPDAYVVRLEQNYRSTQTILNAANGIIANNRGRKKKTLWSDLGEGDQVIFHVFSNGYAEAEFIAEDVARKKRRGIPYADMAVCYRTNAQSRLLEERFVHEGIPYELVGGVNFYSRREIKDILAYLKTIDNARDDLAVMRIINVPKRGIGNTTLEKFSNYAASHDISLFDALQDADAVVSGAACTKVKDFVSLIAALRAMSVEYDVAELIRRLIDQIHYRDYLDSLLDESLADDDENERLHNVEELIEKAYAYVQNTEEPSLTGFLEEVALVADIDLVSENADRAMLMTLHAAKGLEFAHVYITGMEEDVFPSYQACQAENYDPQAMEEERRLAYVGVTRAKESLTLTAARQRVLHGEAQYHEVSRFVREIPQEFLKIAGEEEEGSSFSLPRKEPRRSAGRADTAFLKKPLTATLPPKGMPAGTEPDYTVGDRVRHVKFGEGTVTDLVKETRDYRVSVTFDAAGPKVMYAAFAKLQKV